MKKVICLFVTLWILPALALPENTSVLKIRVQLANVRAEPNTASPVIAQFKLGDLLQSSRKTESWYEVSFIDSSGKSRTGYILASLVEVIVTDKGETPPIQNREPEQPPPAIATDSANLPRENKFGAVAFDFNTGFGYLGVGDINASSKGGNAQAEDSGANITSRFKMMNLSVEAELEALYSVGANVEIGLGIGLIYMQRASTLAYRPAEAGYIEINSWDRPSLNAIPLSLGIYLHLKASPDFKITLHGGGSYFLGKFTLDWHHAWTDTDQNWTFFSQTAKYEAPIRMLGFQGGLRIETVRSRKTSFFFEISGRYAKQKKLTGPFVADGWNTEEFYSIDERALLLWLAEIAVNGKSYRTVTPIAGLEGFNYLRPASLDLSGFIFKTGYKIRF